MTMAPVESRTTTRTKQEVVVSTAQSNGAGPECAGAERGDLGDRGGRCRGSGVVHLAAQHFDLPTRRQPGGEHPHAAARLTYPTSMMSVPSALLFSSCVASRARRESCADGASSSPPEAP
jgi:hypothetical protein